MPCDAGHAAGHSEGKQKGCWLRQNCRRCPPCIYHTAVWQAAGHKSKGRASGTQLPAYSSQVFIVLLAMLLAGREADGGPQYVVRDCKGIHQREGYAAQL